MSIAQDTGVYSEEFLERVRELAIVQLTPSMIATRLELHGKARKSFLRDIKAPHHILSEAFHFGRGIGYQDMMDALHSEAVAGDPDCAELVLRASKENRINELKEELFGI